MTQHNWRVLDREDILTLTTESCKKQYVRIHSFCLLRLIFQLPFSELVFVGHGCRSGVKF